MTAFVAGWRHGPDQRSADPSISPIP